MDNYHIKGNIYEIMELQTISDKFKKQEFVIEVVKPTQRGSFTEYIKMQCINDNCNLLFSLEKKDHVAIKFSASGRKYEKDGDIRYYTNLNVDELSVISKHATGPMEIKPDDEKDYSDMLPGLEKSVEKMTGNKEQGDEPNFDDLPF